MPRATSDRAMPRLAIGATRGASTAAEKIERAPYPPLRNGGWLPTLDETQQVQVSVNPL